MNKADSCSIGWGRCMLIKKKRKEKKCNQRLGKDTKVQGNQLKYSLKINWIYEIFNKKHGIYNTITSKLCAIHLCIGIILHMHTLTMRSPLLKHL